MNPELAVIEAFGKEVLKRVMADEDAADIRTWAMDALTRLGGGDQSAVMTWLDSFDFTDAMMERYKQLANTPEKDRKILDWPWRQWNEKIDPLEDGMLAVVTAPDGQGKTIYAEMISEYWASHKNHIVFVHYELNRKLMMTRRLARHARIPSRILQSGKPTPEQQAEIDAVSPRLRSWNGYITYLHTPGWTMERTVTELSRLNAEGHCDAVVVDYLEKVAASGRQLKMFGSNLYQREADNVEQLKNFAESTGRPVLMIAQMSKEGKQKGGDVVDRNAITGAADKSNRANLVVLLKRDRIETGYSNQVEVVIDKNTMGATGTFTQWMEPEYYTVGDPLTPPAQRGRKP